MIIWLLVGCGTPAPAVVPIPYRRPPHIDHAASHREAMIPSLVATGTIKRLGPPPGAWAADEWRAWQQEVEIDIEDRIYDPKRVPDPLFTSVTVWADMPFSCRSPCVGAVRTDIIGHKVLIKGYHRPNGQIEAHADFFIVDPTPEDIAKALESVPLDRR